MGMPVIEHATLRPPQLEVAELPAAPQRCTFLEGQQCMTLELQDFLRHERLRAAATVTTLHGAAAGIDTWVLIYKKLLE